MFACPYYRLKSIKQKYQKKSVILADLEIPCSAGEDCAYVTPKLPIASAMEVLAMHKEIAHGQGSSVAPGVKPEKFPCPVCSLSRTFNYGGPST